VLKRLSLLLFLALAVVGIPLAGLAQATFRQYTYVADSGGGNVATITSPAIIVGAGDLVYVSCRTGFGSTKSIVVTSSPPNTFTQLAIQAGGPGSQQSSYALNVRQGSTTFACAPNAPAPYQSMIVLDYGVFPNSAAFDKQVGSTTPAGTIYTSPPFSTSASGTELIILCGTVASTDYAFAEGSIGSLKTTLRGVSARLLKGPADAGCEDALSTVSQRSITARITYATRQPWAATVGTFVLKAPPK